MSLHTEIHFEDESCEHLSTNGWLYEPNAAAHYDRARALFPADLLAWIQETQPEAWERLAKNHGSKTDETVLDRVRAQIDLRGTLDVLRHGVDLLGLRQPLKLAEFKPPLALNPDILRRYRANRLRVVRQVRYSLSNQNSIDLVLFLNGLPMATVELKTDFTQSIDDAVDQYRFDRPPKGEPLLSFPSGALVHFAVSSSEVRMTTRLEGRATRFLPFNQGDDGASGNPLNPNGHRTAYLWERVWERESWLEILGRYLISERDKKQQIKRVIFPRYHQLDVTRKLQQAALSDGPGGRYLIQHSAGSGKTNSIAWTAHFFAELHDDANRKLFDTVVVVSDRNVIDAQLQDAIAGFERTKGVVAVITNKDGSKSAKLAEALSGDKKIVICTIQTFPFALKAVRELAATQGKRFAVIADEAHSSQAGEAAAKLKEVLSPQELAELEDGGEISGEDVLAMQMSSRADDGTTTFVAFTATPKNKTLELFGTRPDPTRKPAPDNIPRPFHVYSMRQAIEEGFILDVLRNYTNYTLAYKLAHDGEAVDEAEVEKTQALRKLMGWVKLHPYNIAQKVEIVVEHYRAHVAALLGGKAKAMVVVGSRLEAVRWQQAMRKYIEAKGYRLGTLVAFSGKVLDPDTDEEFSETSIALNPGLKGNIAEAFKGDGFHVLIAANKFQTGFDQPLLCGMYVDKKLAGIQAVQTLSRLNRSYSGKDTTYVVDFANDPNDVLESFKTYYSTAELADTTDPNLVYDLRAKLDATGYYDDFEVQRVANAVLDPASTQKDWERALDPVRDRLVKKFEAAKARLAANANDTDAKEEMDALVLFKSDMGAYVRLYTFLSQIFDYGQTAMEKRAIFYKFLARLLKFTGQRETIDLSQIHLVRHVLRNRGEASLQLGEGEKIKPMTATGSGSVQAKERARLSELVARINDLFEGEFTEGDALGYVNAVKTKLVEYGALVQQAQNNSKQRFARSPDLKSAMTDAVIASLDVHERLSSQVLNDPKARDGLMEVLLNYAGLYEALRMAGGELMASDVDPLK